MSEYYFSCMDKKDIVVVVPIYLSTLSPMEAISLKQCLALLAEYSIVIIKPESLDVTGLQLQYSFPSIETFPDACFSSLRAYNKLVLDETFYLRFESYKYMLIYQLDAYVFKDELLFWASKEYDYVGAPWVPWTNHYLSWSGKHRLLLKRWFWQRICRQKLYNEKYFYYQVGNGGFSLRKIKKMIDITRYYNQEIRDLLADDRPFLPEDIFLLLNLDNKKHQLKKPRFDEALKFAVEHNPQWAYEYSKKELPFGCHNWGDKNMYSFWSNFILCKE